MKVEQVVEEFFTDGVERHFIKGELLLIPDMIQAPPISYLTSGQVVQYDIDDAGNRAVVNIFKPGAFFPLPVAVIDARVEYFFEATTDVTVRQVEAARVRQFLQSEPEVVYDVLSRVYRGMEGVMGRMTQLLNGDAKSRVRYELSILAERFGTKNRVGTDIEVTAGQLAEMTGLTRETVSRTLKALQQEERVRLRRGAVTVIDLGLGDE